MKISLKKSKKKVNNNSFAGKIFRHKKIVIFLFVVMALIFWGYKYTANKKNALVQSTKIQRGEVLEELILSGEVKANNHARLAFQGSGKLSWVGVKEGDNVKKGQALAQLDLNSLKQQLEQTGSDYRYYQAVTDRVLDDVKGHDDDETLEQKETRTQAEVARDKAYRAYEIAKQNISNAVLRAPFDGTVANVKFPFTGINVTVGDPQVEVLDQKTMYFDVSADQTEVIGLNISDSVEIILDSFSEKTFLGKITYISLTPNSGESGSIYDVKIGFDASNDLSKMKIGMSGDAKFILNKKENILNLPPKFIKNDTKGKYIKLENLKNKTYIKTGIEGEENVEVEGDIKEGQTVFD